MKASYTEQQLINAIKNNYTMVDTLKELGLKRTGGSNRAIKIKIQKLGIDISHWKKGGYNSYHFKARIDSSMVFVENSSYTHSSSLRKRLVEENILEYKCSTCDISEWQNKKITLQIDHINGIPNDNRLENLRFLCPNCHSQTPTFGAKNFVGKYKKFWFCKNCNKEISRGNIHCQKCAGRNKVKIDWPPIHVLIEKLETQTRVSLAKELGVSDTAIKKHINKFKNH